MTLHCGGRLAYLLVWHALTLRIFTSASPIPTIHQDQAYKEEGDPEDILVEQLAPDGTMMVNVSLEGSLGLREKLDMDIGNRSNIYTDNIHGQPALPKAARQNTSGSKEFREKWRRIKSPVRRMNRIMLLLKSEMGKVALALEDAKDDCHRKKMTPDACSKGKVVLSLQGKLRRLQSAYATIKAQGSEAELIQDVEVQARKDLDNATKHSQKAKAVLSGRMLALKEIDTRIHELELEDAKNAGMESRWAWKLNQTWVTMRKANEAMQTIESYNVKFNSKLRGVINGIRLGDDNAADDFEAAETIEKEASLTEARAKLLEDKAQRLNKKAISEKMKRLKKADESVDEGQREASQAGILSSDDYKPLDSFGNGRPHPRFGKQKFMAQHKDQPLLVSHPNNVKNDDGDGEADHFRSTLDRFGIGKPHLKFEHAMAQRQALLAKKPNRLNGEDDVVEDDDDDDDDAGISDEEDASGSAIDADVDPDLSNLDGSFYKALLQDEKAPQ